ncbi:dihydroorotate dehydrogenase-like protein [Singulisphaera sp. Ch08]|uniref:Dihydroorotate dehydrogenase-like protein n=1 Tax=Singulisphaera sp. Ch08 TaxID=3120278 RepID=A0AAU7CD93_9BACT
MSIDLGTTYLGLELRNPLVASASPLTGHVEILRQMEEAGVAAVVMPSLFEEQLEREERAVRRLIETGKEQFEEVLSELCDLDSYNNGPPNYLGQVRQAKKELSIPVIASLNGVGPGNWTRHARLLEEAGADAVELNVYFVPTDPNVTGAQVEDRYVETVAAVQEVLTIPLAVKLGPYFSSLPNMARRLVVDVGVEGLVLFNRYLHPDIALETLQISPRLTLSTGGELPLPLRWIGILRPQLSTSLAASTGVHTSDDIFKLLLVGADVTMITSALLRHGPAYIRTLLDGLRARFEESGYDSIRQMKGILSQQNCPDPSAFERANYVKSIASSTPFRDEVSD